MNMETTRESQLAYVQEELLKAVGLANGSGLATLILASASSGRLWNAAAPACLFFLFGLLSACMSQVARLLNHWAAFEQEMRFAPVAAADDELTSTGSVEAAMTLLAARRNYMPLPGKLGRALSNAVVFCGCSSALLFAGGLLIGAVSLPSAVWVVEVPPCSGASRRPAAQEARAAPALTRPARGG